jgi:FKBP-type peptidyl-prolyl cis-trans isomerase
MYGSAEDFLASNAREASVETTDSGLQFKVLEEGQGPSPQIGDFALINYEGMFRTGESFDQGQSVPFALGEPLPGINAVSPVEGFREALGLMNTGARYRVWLPPELAYGDNPPPGSGIEAGDVIVFDIEMLEFVSRDQLIMGLMQMQQQEGGPPPPGQ